MGNDQGSNTLKRWEDKDVQNSPRWYFREERTSFSDYYTRRRRSIITYRICMERRGLASVIMDRVLRNVVMKFYYTRIPNVFRTIACGNDHTLSLDEENKLYTFGSNSGGQLGHGDMLYRNTPERVYVLSHIPIISVAAGHTHSVAIDSQGHVYTFGSNEFGKLGHGDYTKRM